MVEKKRCSSPIEEISFRGVRFFVKRDDLFLRDYDLNLDLSQLSPAERLVLSGNKARKLQFYFQNDFPNISLVISYGSAQSNMLASLAVLANLKSWQLDFYVDHIPENLAGKPRGNYRVALECGANIIPVKTQHGLKEHLETTVLPDSKNMLFIPEGGATLQAETGIKILADELIEWVQQQNIPNPKLMLPSGTGTTAYYLQKYLPFEVLTCACVGSREYLQEQFFQLEKSKNIQPTILPPIVDAQGRGRKFQFGKLYLELYQLWTELQKETGIEFDLLYDPLGWMHTMAYLNSPQVLAAENPLTLIYLHQGGLLGNETMLERYKRLHKKIRS